MGANVSTANMTVYGAIQFVAGATNNFFLKSDALGNAVWSAVTKGDVGLGNVDNTSDVNKPVSTATQTALNLKEDLANKDATGGYVGLTAFSINFKNAANTFTSLLSNANTAARTYTFQDRDGTIADDTDLATKQGNLVNSAGLASALSDESGTGAAVFSNGATLVSPSITTPTGLTKDDVSLNNVDNTSDANKPLSTAATTALALKENAANKDATGGYVGLTGLNINFKNVANTFTSMFSNTNTAARTYLFQDRNGIIADDTDLATKQGNLVDSAGLANALSNETGTGLAVFNNGATLVSPTITTPTGIVKGDVGLGNVDDTSDLAKPISTLTQTALDLKEDIAKKDANNGYAGLTGLNINFKNVANTVTSMFSNTNTAARTYLFQDRNGIIADDTDLATKQGNLVDSAGLANALSDESGTGLAVFNNGATLVSPTLTSPAITNPTGIVKADISGIDQVDNTSDLAKPISTLTQAALDALTTSVAGKLDANAPLGAGGTNTKITYDTKGLVTGAAPATTVDIDPSTDRNYVTDAQLASLATMFSTVLLPSTSGALDLKEGSNSYIKIDTDTPKITFGSVATVFQFLGGGAVDFGTSILTGDGTNLINLKAVNLTGLFNAIDAGVNDITTTGAMNTGTLTATGTVTTGPIIAGGHIGATTDTAGQITSTGGAATFTFANAYTTAPFCTFSPADPTAATDARTTDVYVTTTTTDVTINGTLTAGSVWTYQCMGQ